MLTEMYLKLGHFLHFGQFSTLGKYIAHANTKKILIYVKSIDKIFILYSIVFFWHLDVLYGRQLLEAIKMAIIA